MRRTVLTRLSMIFIILLIATVLHSAATAQSVSVSDSLATAPATSGVSSVPRSSASDDPCEQRLLKALDALEKAEKALGAAMNEIEARKQLDALKDQLIAVKDLIIADQDQLIKRLRKDDNSVWGRIKKILKIAEKAALIAIGVYVGRGL
jgi:hypothetical protein